FCTPDQIKEEILKTIEITMRLLKKFGFEDIKVALSTKPEKAMGDDALWDKATKALESALKKTNIDYTINEGDGAFYGPKIDFQIKDSMDREWQLTTIQLDFFQPENFDLEYVTSAGTKARPVMIHRALYGSLERFLGILIEHYKGNLPFWIAPVQVRVLTITDDQKKYAQSIYNKLKESGIRAELDESSDPISGQIKAAQLEKIPWMIVVGNKEMTNNTVTLRFLNGKQEFGISIDELIKRASEENK
ncbi:threonine--tRNA ligase, partial [Candidatus Dependentiae bacterium]|nr:threonine--tRNA ligase [Candidatus Dependentiae bacterium]